MLPYRHDETTPIVGVGNAMKPETGRKMIDMAMSYVGCHYLHGAYGAAPPDENGVKGPKEGSPARAGRKGEWELQVGPEPDELEAL